MKIRLTISLQQRQHITPTHCVIQPAKIGVAVLQPIDEFHGVVSGIALAVRRQAEDRQAVGYRLQVDQLLLQNNKARN